MSELSRVSGVNRRMLDRYRDGMEPSLMAAAKIARALNLPLDALVYDTYDQVSTLPLDDSDAIRIPFFNVAASAGPGSEAPGHEMIVHLNFSRTLLRKLGVRPEDAHAISARGDSMLPTIANGQIILLDRSVRRVREDAIYVLSIDQDIRLKRIQKGLGGSLILKSDNPAYEPEHLSPADAEQLKVEGRVFWTERAL